MTYTVTVNNWTGNNDVPICNAIVFDDGGGVLINDEACACPYGDVPPGTPCGGYSKTEVSTVGNIVTYQIE